MDMSRVSACSYPLRERPWRESLQVLAAAGFDQVDLLGRMPHLSLDPAEWDAAEVKAVASGLGLSIVNLGTYVGRGFASADPAEQERELAQVQRAIELAAFFGARSIRVSAGNDDPANIPQITPWFRRSAEVAAAAGVYMGFETHGGGISGNPERSVELCRAVGSPYFGVLYDPCNIMHSGLDYRLALWTMREHITHVHFKDAEVTREGFRLTMLGQGQVDFRWCMEMLDALGYQGHWALEYELKQPAPEVGLPKWFAASQRI